MLYFQVKIQKRLLFDERMIREELQNRGKRSLKNLKDF